MFVLAATLTDMTAGHSVGQRWCFDFLFTVQQLRLFTTVPWSFQISGSTARRRAANVSVRNVWLLVNIFTGLKNDTRFFPQYILLFKRLESGFCFVFVIVCLILIFRWEKYSWRDSKNIYNVKISSSVAVLLNIQRKNDMVSTKILSGETVFSIENHYKPCKSLY